MSQPHADRNLLFGILALQMDFITRDALVAAMSAWVLAKEKPLGELLLAQGALRPDAHALLQALVEKYLEMHGHDAERSLAALSSIGSVRERLKHVADPEVEASLAHVSQARQGEDDPHATRPPSAGTPTSAGLRFRILRPHARGGLGEVFVAHDVELHREVALKEIQGSRADDPDSRARFLLEAEVTGGLEHPGIVPVYGLGCYADGRPFYAMRFIKGDTLHDAIKQFHSPGAKQAAPGERSVQLRKLLGRFLDVCNAIEYAHSRGVLHRDLKPGNIMLGKYGETLVVDWGLAKPRGAADATAVSPEGAIRPESASEVTPTQAGSAVGTPEYMSPEQAAGRLEQLGPASDVYNLGATLYCLLTRRAPCRGEDVGTVLRQVEQGEFPRPRAVEPSIPAALEAVCLKAMTLRPEDRYGSPRALADDIERFLADEPVAVYREPWRVRAARWVRRHRTKVTAAVAAVAVAAGCLAVATVLLIAANQRERTAKEEVQRQKERADHNLARARKAVEDYCTNVAGDKRLKQADLHPLRKSLLETAVPFYQEFAEQQGDDPELQADRGRAYRNLARLRADMGEMAQAITDCQQMRAIFADLVRLHPDVPAYRQELASSHNNLGFDLTTMGRHEEGKEEYRQALAIEEKLLQDFPNSPGYREDLAWSHYGFANLLREEGKHKEAEEEYRQALAIQKTLAQELPAIPLYRSRLADSHNNLGLTLTRSWPTTFPTNPVTDPTLRVATLTWGSCGKTAIGRRLWQSTGSPWPFM
jgi:serine/threonine-protein kinase